MYVCMYIKKILNWPSWPIKLSARTRTRKRRNWKTKKEN